MLAQSSVVCKDASITENQEGCLQMENDEKKDQKKVLAGVARANALEPARRSEIAQNAAKKRWGVKPVGVLHKGSFASEFGLDVECYVLDDTTKTAVISQRGMGEAIGFSRRGERLKGFANSKGMEGYIGRELKEKLENPIVFQRVASAAENEISARAYGYDATILIDICKAILEAKADGKLSAQRYANMIKQAQIIMNASAKSGIRQLVYALAGYSPSTDEVISAFRLYVQEEAKKYEAEFPNELYEQWHRLYDIPAMERGKPWQFRHLTVKHVYIPLADSNGALLKLMKILRAQDGSGRKKLFQFLNIIGARALRIHLGRVLEMSESSKSAEEYERKIADRFGKQPSLDLPIPNSTA
jgi:P63C domain